jgi:AraC-like DNA-binding protein
MSIETFSYILLKRKWNLIRNRVENKPWSSSSHHISSLIEKVHTNHEAHRKLEQYASEIHVTDKHLSKLCVKALGMNYRELSEMILLIRIFDLFFNRMMSMTQIAEKLHFADQSHFNHFFKEKMKITPMQYKSKLLI